MLKRKRISVNDILVIFMITVTSSRISCAYEPGKYKGSYRDSYINGFSSSQAGIPSGIKLKHIIWLLKTFMVNLLNKKNDLYWINGVRKIFTIDDHSILMILKWISPAGTMARTVSPAFAPNSARPMGDSFEMRPLPGSASCTPTM